MTLDNLEAMKRKIADDFAQLAHFRRQLPFVKIGELTFELIPVSSEERPLTDLDILSCNFTLKPVFVG